MMIRNNLRSPNGMQTFTLFDIFVHDMNEFILQIYSAKIVRVEITETHGIAIILSRVSLVTHHRMIDHAILCPLCMIQIMTDVNMTQSLLAKICHPQRVSPFLSFSIFIEIFHANCNHQKEG